MKVAAFSTKPYVEHCRRTANGRAHDLKSLDTRLPPATALLAHRFYAVIAFLNNDFRLEVICEFANEGVQMSALRFAGFKPADLVEIADRTIANVSVFEHDRGPIQQVQAD